MLLFFALVALCILAVLIILRISQKQKAPSQPPVPIPTRYIPPPLPSIPQEETLPIDGLEVKNIYKEARDRNIQGDVDFSSDSAYSLTYLPDYDQFLITILKNPFEENRTKAEDEFIEKLGITKDQACILNVTVSVPFSVDPERAGVKHPLSFCSQ